MMLWSYIFLIRLGFCFGQVSKMLEMKFGEKLTISWEKKLPGYQWNTSNKLSSQVNTFGTQSTIITFHVEIQAPNYTLQSWKCNGSNFHGYIENKKLFSVILLERLKPKKIEIPLRCQENFKVLCVKTKNPSDHKYIAIRKNLSQSAAQDYCLNNLTNFNVNGKLASFHSDSDLKKIGDLINTIENNGKNKTYMYWTGLKFENNTTHCNFSDGTDASFADNKNITGKGECVTVENNGTCLKRSKCLETKYFICKIANFSSQATPSPTQGPTTSCSASKGTTSSPAIRPSPSTHFESSSPVKQTTSSSTRSSSKTLSSKVNPTSTGLSQASSSSNNEATSLASSSPSIPLSSSIPQSIVTSTYRNATAQTVASAAAGTNGTKTLTATPNIMSSLVMSGSASTSLFSKVNPTSTGTSMAQSTLTTADKIKKAYREVNLTDKDVLNQIVNITTKFLTSQNNSNDVNPAIFLAPVLEDKMIEYAKINLHKRHNGTYNKTTKYFEMLITFATPEKFPRGYVTFPEVEQNSNGGEQKAKSDNFISMPLGSSLPNNPIFVGILFNTEESSVNTTPGRNTNEPKLISKIISAEIDPKPNTTEDFGNITFILSHGKGYVNVSCAFLDESKDAPTFSKRGCSAVSFDETRTKCTCNHMTSFAVVAQINRNPIDASHRKALSIITYVGMTLSLIGEVLTVGCYVLLIGLKTEQAHLHTNLALSLALAQIFFLIGMSTASSEAACLVVTAMIHYFYLVTFCWMLVEGFHLYLMVVKVFSENSYLKFYYLSSWTTPLIIVSLALIAAAVSSTGIYGYLSIEEVCWISYENNYIWFFLGPVLVICLANLLLLILVVWEMTKMNKTKAGGPSLQFRKSVKACLLLFPILGTSWLFAVILMVKYSLAVEYIFNVLNSIQGFLIFLFYVMRSSEIRAVLQQRKARWATTMDLTHHQSTYHKTTTTSNKSKPTSASSIKPVLGSWTGVKPRSSSTLSSRRSSQSTSSPRDSPSPRNTPSPQDNPSPCDIPNSRETATPTTCHSRNIQFKSPSRLTTSDPLDLFEIPRRPLSRNKISPEVEIYDAETSA